MRIITVMTTGSKRRRGGGWELRVYTGTHPITGRRRYARKTVYGNEKEVDRQLRDFVDEVEDGLHSHEVRPLPLPIQDGRVTTRRSCRAR